MAELFVEKLNIPENFVRNKVQNMLSHTKGSRIRDTETTSRRAKFSQAHNKILFQAVWPIPSMIIWLLVTWNSDIGESEV